MSWFEDNQRTTCPICRFDLRYKRCRHPVGLMKLFSETVLFTPSTLAAGGTVLEECALSRSRAYFLTATMILEPLGEAYHKSKREFEQDPSEKTDP